MKALALRVGVVLLVAAVGSCAAGIGIAQVGGNATAGSVRDVATIILALLYLVPALIWAAIYFGLAWAIGRYGGKLPAGVHWMAGKVYRTQTIVEGGIDRGVVRPLARGARGVAAAGALLRGVAGRDDKG
jgi:hypothetical protein